MKPTLYDYSEDSQAPLFHRRLNSRSSDQDLNPFDGPFDSGTESLPTSGTWTTVSNRIFTDSSAGSSSRDTQRFVDEYNRLALKHGLPRFTEAPMPVDIGMSTAIVIVPKSDRYSQGYRNGREDNIEISQQLAYAENPTPIIFDVQCQGQVREQARSAKVERLEHIRAESQRCPERQEFGGDWASEWS